MNLISDRFNSVSVNRRTYRRSIAIISFLALVAGILLLTEKAHQMRLSVYSLNCVQNSYEIAFQLRKYKERHGHYPPPVVYDENGKPMHSWRVLILRDLDRIYSEYNFDEPWDGPNNRKLADRMPHFYKCAMDRTSPPNHTSFLAVTGKGTAFPTDQSSIEEKVRVHPENKIIVAEVSNSGVHWMEPRDLDVETMSFLIDDESRPSIRGPHAKGAAVIFGNLDHGWLNRLTPPDRVKSMLTTPEGERTHDLH